MNRTMLCLALWLGSACVAQAQGLLCTGDKVKIDRSRIKTFVDPSPRVVIDGHISVPLLGASASLEDDWYVVWNVPNVSVKCILMGSMIRPE